MKKKIVVYTICRNEEKHVLRWLENTRDADLIIVGDTGSNDNTVALLKENGAIVFDVRVSPWRFDEARNQLLDRLPEDVDICISLDFDEHLSAGWRRNVESAWQKGVTRLSYDYIDKNEETSGWSVTIRTSRIHKRRDYMWVYPVHELLTYRGQNLEHTAYVNGLTVTHTPDPLKDRTGYLELMELAAEENPNDVRILHHLGRDYMQYGQFDKCIEMMRRTEKLPGITPEQKRACLRFIARAYGENNSYHKAKKYLLKIIDEAPNCSAAYIEHAILSYKYQKWDDIVILASRFDDIDFQNASFYNEFSSSEGLLYDITSIAFYYSSDYEKALGFAKKALKKGQDKIRLKKNIDLFEERLHALGAQTTLPAPFIAVGALTEGPHYGIYFKECINKDWRRYEHKIVGGNDMKLAAHEVHDLSELALSCVNSITSMALFMAQVKDAELKSLIQKHFPFHIKDYNTKVEFLNRADGAITGLPVPEITHILNSYTKSPVSPQPVTPRTDVKELNDREIATSYLLTLKRAGREYAWAAMEMSNPEIRSFCEDAFMMASHHAYDIWQWMVKKGYYALDEAPQNLVNMIGGMYQTVDQETVPAR